VSLLLKIKRIREIISIATIIAMIIIGTLDIIGITAPSASIFNSKWNGTSIMKTKLSEDGYSIKCLFSSPSILSNIEPPDVLIILRPTCKYTPEEVTTIINFVQNGGGLFIADDYGFAHNITEQFGINYVSKNSSATLLEFKEYYKQPSLPIVKLNIQPILNTTLTTQPTLRIVLNKATALKTSANPNIVTLGSTSDESFLDINGNKYLDPSEPQGPLPVAVALTYGKGRVVIISDVTLFLNDLINLEDNYVFLQTAVKWLSNGKENATIAFDESKLGWEDRISMIGFFSSLFYGSLVLQKNVIILILLTIVLTPLYAASIAWYAGDVTKINIEKPRTLYYKPVFESRKRQLYQEILKNPKAALKETHECLKTLLEDAGISQDVIENLDLVKNLLTITRNLYLNFPQINVQEIIHTIMEINDVLKGKTTRFLTEILALAEKERNIIENLIKWR